MKRMKKLFALLLAVVMMMGLGVTASAASLGTGEGNIEITNATVGESYTIYKIFDTLESGKGATATEAQKTFYESQANNPFKFTSNGTGKYIVSVADGKTPQDVISFLQGFVTKAEDGTIQVNEGFSNVVEESDAKEAITTTVIFDRIPFGYYLVKSSLGAVVTVNSTNPDVSVIDKNQDGGSSFTKTVDSTDEVVEIGEEFTYTLTFDATNYDGETPITEYTITDTMDDALDLVYTPGDVTYGVTVKVGETTIDDAQVSYANHELEINIPWGAENEGNVAFKYPSPSTVTVTYTVKLNAGAEIQENIENDARLSWTGNSTGTSTEETIKTYALAVKKVDEKGNPLAGATFTVMDNNKQNVKVTLVKEGTETEAAVYVVDPVNGTTTVTSPKSGLIVIKGVDNTKYTLTETVAPEGYNLLNKDVDVTPSESGSTTIITYYDENGNVTDKITEDTTTTTVPVPVTAEVVVNKAGATLPSTGGMGTTLIYIAGAVLVIGAGVLLVVRRRMNAER